jgi:hypothetical protein
MKRTLTANLPNGKVVSRKTTHTYCYICAVDGLDGWNVLSWHHNYDGAEVQVRSRWGKIFPSIRIVPVNEMLEFTA